MEGIELTQRDYELYLRGAAVVNTEAYMIASHAPTAYERRLYDYYRGLTKSGVIDIQGCNKRKKVHNDK